MPSKSYATVGASLSETQKKAIELLADTYHTSMGTLLTLAFDYAMKHQEEFEQGLPRILALRSASPEVQAYIGELEQRLVEVNNHVAIKM